MSAGGQPAQQPPGFVGVVVEVLSYTELRGHVLLPASRLLRYGALAHVHDHTANRSYLALVVDVSEKTPVPIVNQQALQKFYQNLIQQGATLQQINQALQQLLSPSQGLIRWYSVRELRLRVLGEIVSGTPPSLAAPEEPPRPLSTINDPSPALLQGLLTKNLGLRGLELGELAYNPGVPVVLDPLELTKHMAVLGQTGSGKSETVKRLAAEYAWRKEHIGHSGGVVVLDVSGEYSGITYRVTGKTPLLEAILYPDRYTTLPAKWVREAPKTILVPFDLAVMPLHKSAEEQYAREIGVVVDMLQPQQGATVKRVVGLLYGRHGIYRVDGSNAFTQITRSQAAALLQDPTILLVVAAPLPDSLALEEIVELSATRSEYYEHTLAEVSDFIGLLDVERIISVSALAEILLTAWRVSQLIKQHTGNKPSPATVAEEITNTVGEIVDDISKGVNPVNAIKNRMGRLLQGRFVPSRPWLNLLALPVIRDNPRDDMDRVTIMKALAMNYPVPNMKWRDYLERYLANAVQEYLGGPWQTVAAVARNMKRVSRMVSAYLDASQYRLLVERLVNGFSIVHLASPSRGNVRPHIARLLDEVFTVSSTGYRGDRYTLLVVEEAHNLAPAEEDTASKRALLRIAREGRKWGLSLVLVSQRPGFIDQGILSQASSLVALRMTNPDDLSSLRRSVESTAQDTVERLPDLDPGQAIVSGPAVPERRIPLLAHIKMLAPLHPTGGRAAWQPSARKGGGGAHP